MAKVFMPKIVEEVAHSKTAEPILRRAATQRAGEVFDDAVLEMKAEFEKHPVTVEIDGGNGAANISQTLGGGAAPKNLFSFIGFDNGDKPTDEVRKRLDPTHVDGPKLRYSGKDYRKNETRIRYQFYVITPDKDAIYDATPIPWAKGLSWAQKIEDNIPGFANFMAKFMPNPPSHSEGGVQSKNVLRGGDYTPPPGGYLTQIFTRFMLRLRMNRR
jgi:hypothetical protein